MAIGCYTEPYLPASFKLIPFKAKDASSDHGRRGAEGEFPFGETTAYADLGRKLRRYSLSGRFDENDHVLKAAALIAVVELRGPGPLVHPTRGVILSAACTSLKVRDEIEEGGGVTYVDMEFVEANNWPNGLSLVGQLLGLIITPIITSSRSSFTSNYQPTQIQAFREDAVVNAAQEQVEAVSVQYAAATTDTAREETRSQILHDLNTVASDDSEASNTETMDRALALGMNAIALSLYGGEKFDVFRSLANSASKASTFNTPASLAEDAVYALVRTTAAAFMAEGALESTEFRTGQILEQADIIDSLLEQEMLAARSTCQNELFFSLSTFRIEVAAQLANKAYNAPGLIEYDFSGQVHPLRAAYSIHGDAKRHRELEGLNTVGPLGRVGSTVVGISV